MKTAVAIIAVIFLVIAGCSQNQQPTGPSPLSYAQALAAANSSATCLSVGNLTGAYMHNDATSTWWFDLDTVKPGCSPACVVYDTNQSTEVNWRCTGLMPPQSPPPLMTLQQLTFGDILVGQNGMTLYVFLKDDYNKSNCNGGCAAIWPPLIYNGNGNLSGNLGLVTRSDGSSQVTYNGMPLYYYAKDTAPGDTKGQGFNNLWFVAEANMTAFPQGELSSSMAVAIANSSSCMQVGNLTGSPSYNNNSMTWWIDLDTVKPGCSPACVVYQNGSAEVNWRCTGLGTNMTAPQPSSKVPILAIGNTSALGQILTTNNGMALYVYVYDKASMPTCTTSCSMNWPPLIFNSNYSLEAQGLPGTVSTVQRSDGSLQVTYNGMPLYTYRADSHPGEALGNGVGGIWFAVTPNMTTFPPQPKPTQGGY